MLVQSQPQPTHSQQRPYSRQFAFEEIQHNTLMSLVEIATKQFQADAYHTPLLRKVATILQIMGSRALVDQPTCFLMRFDHSKTIQHLFQSQDPDENQIVNSYLGLFPRLEFQSEEQANLAPICVPLADKAGLGNPFWIHSRNILFRKHYQNGGYKELTRAKPHLGLFYSILLNHQTEIITILQKINPSWFHILWAKLYCFYQQELIKKIREMQQQNECETLQELTSFGDVYDLQSIDWKSISLYMNAQSLDSVSFELVKQMLTQRKVRVDDIIQRMLVFKDNRQYQKGVLFAGTVLASATDNQQVKRKLYDLAKDIGFEEQILQLIYPSDKEVMRSYFNRSNRVDPSRINNFTDKKFRAEMTRMYLENDKRQISSVISNIPQMQRTNQLLQSLPFMDILSLPETLKLLEREIDLIPPNKKDYARQAKWVSQKYKQLSKVLTQDKSPAVFNTIEGILTTKPQQYPILKPYTHQRGWLKALITKFYETALYLLQNQSDLNRKQVISKSKTVLNSLQSYINQVLSKEDIRDSLMKGLGQILLRDPHILNDHPIRL